MSKINFKIKKWDAVVTRKWDAIDEKCAICRNSLMEDCITCQSDTTKDCLCNPVWGECRHAYHKHCINKWIKTRKVCPLDNGEWSQSI